LVLVSDGSEEIETVTVVDVLRRAGALVELSKVDKNLHIGDNKLECTMSRGVKLHADSHFSLGHT
jgi:4-methyl-5(b-hydroxyethyl)-thiazole monophosphate biosynthesis